MYLTEDVKTKGRLSKEQCVCNTCNPGITFSPNMEQIVAAHDLTNPRDLYTILTNRAKSIEELAFKLKRELSQTCQPSGESPTLSRTQSMNDIDQFAIKDWRLGNKLSHVGTVEHDGRNLDMLIFDRPGACTEDLNQPEENKENRGTVNLPQLNQQVNRSGGTNKLDGRRERENVLVELPLLPGNCTMANGKVELGQHLNKDGQSKNLLRVRRELSVSDSKLHKWFSEMPNEVFDKAQRALMEEGIKDKLGEYQRNRNRKMSFPNKSVHVWLGSSMKKVPNHYLELKVDSFGRNACLDDKLNKYKLQQKSLHNLKMRDISETDKLPRDDNFPRLALQHRSLTTLALAKTKPKADKSSKDDNVIKIPTERGLTTVYMNDTFEPDDSNLRIKQRNSVSNFEEYKERLSVMKEAHEFQRTKSVKSRADSPPPNTVVEEFDMSNNSSNERDTTKAAIVNLSLKKEVPRTRKNIERPIRDFLLETYKSYPPEGKANNAGPKKQDVGFDVVDGAGLHSKDPKHDHSTESKTSSNSQHSTKAALKRFNTLEVFADNFKGQQIHPRKDGFKDSKLRSSDGLRGIPLPPSLKHDIRQHGWSGAHTMRDPLNIQNCETKKQDFVFRFEPGEVFVSRKNGTQMQNHTRSSERARVIYGKIVNQHRDWNDKRDLLHKSKEDIREGKSLMTASTKLDSYPSDVSRNTGTSYSTRRDDGAYNDMLVIGSRSNTMFDPNSRHLSTMAENQTDSLDVFMNGHNKRDVSTETEKTGSTKGSTKARYPVDTNPALDGKASSGLSVFIVDDNDGDSLVSNPEDRHGKKSGRSGGYSV
mgnify:FL=1